MDRVGIINGLMGTPYSLGGQIAGTVDCYGCATRLQRDIFERSMPDFAMPATAGRIAIAAAISVHPERHRWIEISDPVDGALVTMARNDCGYHIGTWLAEDGGLIVHALEKVGVVADTMPALMALGWRRFRFHIPALG